MHLLNQARLLMFSTYQHADQQELQGMPKAAARLDAALLPSDP